MARQIIKITEGDLRKIINKAVNRVMVSEGWEDTYRKWTRGEYKDNEEGEELNRQWSKELKDEHPDRRKRMNAVKKANEKIDTEKGKNTGKWKNYDDELDESIRKAMRNVIREMVDNDWSEDEIETRIDTEANMDDYPPMRKESRARANRMIKEDECDETNDGWSKR